MNQNESHNNFPYVMPDIAKGVIKENQLSLDRVGMTDIDLPIQFEVEEGKSSIFPAKVDAFVSLDQKEAKGIHMSRLFLSLQKALVGKNLNVSLMNQVLEEFIESHSEISESAELRLRFDLLVERPSLLSENSGWRSYPVELVSFKNKERIYNSLSFRITYSSTCPCSAALARQLIQEKFSEDFSQQEQISVEKMREWLGQEESICATPHSQRSYADIKIKFNDEDPLRLMNLIQEAENSLGTPVQAAVKREDEQEFARLNGRNLMFCEDAARKLKALLLSKKRIHDFWIKVEHKESLHPHNAVAVTVKGLDGGFWP